LKLKCIGCGASSEAESSSFLSFGWSQEYRTTKQIPGLCFNLFGKSFCLTTPLILEQVEDPICQLDDSDLIKIVENSQADTSDRMNAIELLGFRQCRAAVPVLLSIVESRESAPDRSPPEALITASLFALGQIGELRTGPLIMEVAQGEPRLTHPAIVALGLLQYEPAIPYLVELVRSEESFQHRALAARVLKTGFGRNDGLETFWPLLLSRDQGEFERAANVFLRTEEKSRDAAFTEMVVKAMEAQTDPNRLVGLIGALTNADDGERQAARFLYSLLDDERKAREPVGAKRKAAVGDFAAHYLAQLLRYRISLPVEAAYSLGFFKKERQQFREFIKREAAKILFDQ
jgi:HEAT repeat protein